MGVHLCSRIIKVTPVPHGGSARVSDIMNGNVIDMFQFFSASASSEIQELLINPIRDVNLIQILRAAQRQILHLRESAEDGRHRHPDTDYHKQCARSKHKSDEQTPALAAQRKRRPAGRFLFLWTQVLWFIEFRHVISSDLFRPFVGSILYNTVQHRKWLQAASVVDKTGHGSYNNAYARPASGRRVLLWNAPLGAERRENTMSEGCSHDCEHCAENCGERKSNPADFLEKPHAMSSIKKVIGVVSGKGGVGKSLVTSLMAVAMNRRGSHTAILDADVTGPSIPKAFGLHQRAMGNELGLLPVRTKTGIDVMSVNLLLDDECAPVVWRGPIIANTVKQFWTDVIWKDVDYMFVDMPPGTGDVPLTVFQSLPLDGILIVTSPQELVAMIVDKAVNMALMMNVPIVGIVENMSYVKCPDCGREIRVFGESHVEEIAAKHGLRVLARLPMDPDVAKNCDSGLVELCHTEPLEEAAKAIEALPVKEK